MMMDKTSRFSGRPSPPVPHSVDPLRRFLQNMIGRLPAVRARDEHAKNLADELSMCRKELSLYRAQLADARCAISAVKWGGFIPPYRGGALTGDEQRVADQFHELYYRLGQGDRYTYHIAWLGYSVLKCPLDLWIYQELISRLQPEFIIETGTASGGSALFLASMCELIGRGRVLTIDIDARERQRLPIHPRIEYLTGSSIDQAVMARVHEVLGGKQAGLVILDSDHHRDHVLAEMSLFAPLVSPGGYLVVEDTNINGHPAYPDFGPGPMEAVRLFLSGNADFQVDTGCERFILTMNPGGFLRRAS